ncbi:MAG: UvrD-helicase domain-containing protein [Candidatus Diapherotrites archaeon]|nr:UvrD-helicase domain-containing protein [Candidatus Diapherotrites archaeon]
MDYLIILNALKEIPFGVGKNLLIDFLKGDKTNASVVKNRLYLKKTFGSMSYDKEELNAMIDSLVLNSMITLTSLPNNRFWRVLELSSKGRKEIFEPTMHKRKLSFNFKETKTEITEKDKKLFEKFSGFLKKFNDEQKKAITCGKKHILCIAGPGSGKTTVLTKRVEFLVDNCLVNPKRILAITFTRKARQEMESRLEKLSKDSNLGLVRVETFNSFCEKILRQHNNLLYSKPVRVLNYRDKIFLVNRALSSNGLNMQQAINEYFSPAQRRGKNPEQLASIFMNDCFFIRDFFKFKNKPIDGSFFDVLNADHKKTMNIVLKVCKFIENAMQKQGLRDFADQLVDTISFFEKHLELVPQFDHVLIDEYHDVNSTQIKLVDLLKSKNVFCVGDPRQSIYGWRGSDIKYILNFEEKYPDCEIITLTKNYRSTKHIVDFINSSIKGMGLPDLESELAGDKNILLLKCGSAESEIDFLAKKIIASKTPRSEIFVLARTNKQLNELSQSMEVCGISHVVRSDELRKTTVAGEGDVTLATIHAIKGLEAEMVFVMGCNGANFPCKGSEHPIIEILNLNDYDKEEEERRLFYVALSRAKKGLCLTYSGKKPTNFITKNMFELLSMDVVKKESKSKTKKQIRKKSRSFASKIVSTGQVMSLMKRLKEWRGLVSKEQNVPAFMVLHDRTLLNIVQIKPQTNQDLKNIFGLGPAKIEKYGQDILNIVKN